MKFVTYTDENGKIQQSFIPESMNIEDAYMGIPVNPPDLSRLDWEQITIEINNLLIQRNLITLKDVADNGGSLQNSILSIIQPKIIELYKENSGYEKANGKSLNGNHNDDAHILTAKEN